MVLRDQKENQEKFGVTMALIKIHHGYAGNLSELDVNDFALVEVSGAKFSVALLEKLASSVGNKFEVFMNNGVVVVRPHQCSGDKGETNAPKPAPAPVTPAVARPEVKPEAKPEAPKAVEPKVETKVETKVEPSKGTDPKAAAPAVTA